ncbi:MAG: hypothetical protein JWM27_1014 [Gemmatimonadetes bacterium]|nr:hypothetical protein [Gemmatimonadota bacterium]
MKTLLVALALAVGPQGHVPAVPANYAGNWTLDVAQSKNLPPYYSRVHSHKLAITQDDQHLNVGVDIDFGQPQPDHLSFVYAFDGIETKTTSSIRTRDGMVSVPTTLKATVADDGGLHITISHEIPMPSGPVTGVTTEDWHLSPDHATLTVHRVDDGPRGRMEADMVFVKG